MELEELKKRIEEFDKKAGFDKTEFSKLMELMEEELKILTNFLAVWNKYVR